MFLYSFLPISLWAEAPVEEATASSTGSYSSMDNGDPEMPLSQDNTDNYANQTNSTFNPRDPASLLAKINEMQSEIQRLRGKLEVQSYELKKLKEQQKAYYNDLDQRISMLSSGKATAVSTLSLDDTTTTATPDVTNKISNTATVTPSTTSTTVSKSGEEASYNTAYEFIQNKQFPEAISAMKTFIQQYPNGKYASNAHYWLGELLLAQHQDQEAIQEFSTVVNNYPTSNKVSAAMLKLGYIYASLGDTAKAKTEFSTIEKMFPGSTTAQLAHTRLQTLN